MSTYKAHIFKQRNVGEREEVKLKIFGPDGEEIDLDGPGGGSSSMLFGGYSQPHPIDDGIPRDEVTILPFGNSSLAYVEGFEVEPGDLQILVPVGGYLTKILPYWNWDLAPVPPAEAGSAMVGLHFVPTDSEESEIVMNSIHVNTLYEEQHFGDYPFDQNYNMVKVDVEMVPTAGHFELRAEQYLQDNPMALSCGVWIAKL